MQIFSYDLTATARRLVRKWRLAVVAFYGSLLALMLVFALTTNSDIQVAHTDVAVTPQK